MEAVYTLLQEKSVRDLTIEEVAKRAGVSKPTLYKWWPTKAALVMTLFQERIATYPPPVETLSAEPSLRWRVRRMFARRVFAKGVVATQATAHYLQDWILALRRARCTCLWIRVVLPSVMA